jgi:hypothetical protein
MKDQSITPPPAPLLSSDTAPPEARTVIAEVRTDASIPFDPQAAPGFLVIPNVGFGALIQWRVDVSWSQAQEIQLWLTGAPAQFLDYVGTFLATGLSHASYTLVLGMRVPIPRDAYQTSFNNALNGLLGVAGLAGWPAELISFLKMMLNQPSSREEFLNLASNVGDLTVGGSPLIQKLIA